MNAMNNQSGHMNSFHIYNNTSFIHVFAIAAVAHPAACSPTGRTNWKMPGMYVERKPVAKILKHLRTVIICTFNHLQHRLFVNTIGKIGTLYQTWRSCCNKNQPGYPVPLWRPMYLTAIAPPVECPANVKSRRPKASTTPLTSSDRCCNRIRKTVYPSSQASCIDSNTPIP